MAAATPTTAARSTSSQPDHRTEHQFWNITLDVVTGRAVSVTREPALSPQVRIVRRTSTKLS